MGPRVLRACGNPAGKYRRPSQASSPLALTHRQPAGPQPPGAHKLSIAGPKTPDAHRPSSPGSPQALNCQEPTNPQSPSLKPRIPTGPHQLGARQASPARSPQALTGWPLPAGSPQALTLRSQLALTCREPSGLHPEHLCILSHSLKDKSAVSLCIIRIVSPLIFD